MVAHPPASMLNRHHLAVIAESRAAGMPGDELPTERDFTDRGIRKYARVEIGLRDQLKLRETATILRELAHRIDMISRESERGVISLMREVQSEVYCANLKLKEGTKPSRRD